MNGGVRSAVTACLPWDWRSDCTPQLLVPRSVECGMGSRDIDPARNQPPARLIPSAWPAVRRYALNVYGTSWVHVSVRPAWHRCDVPGRTGECQLVRVILINGSAPGNPPAGGFRTFRAGSLPPECTWHRSTCRIGTSGSSVYRHGRMVAPRRACRKPVNRRSGPGRGVCAARPTCSRNAPQRGIAGCGRTGNGICVYPGIRDG